ncbi:MAG: tRNA uridine-5-carboxymethylaminomethyl(34) synthesis enzyme MnmG [Erysipelotrichaceae bacterium]|nr:tRNA uridine-5-carboxymethylaminomethyl(34) synthesis enzyme MnmG [Erysipelotrichaceae bacterium]
MPEIFNSGAYDIAVIGAGHAGCEAALACARLGMRTVIFSINLDSVAMLPCNPSIGGTGKGHLVREIDALGGQMGLISDKAMVQSKMLNTGKGPAVHSLRAQVDKSRYHIEMKKVIEQTEGLELKQGEIVEIEIEKGQVKSVLTSTGARYEIKAVVLATGTYLGGKIFIGSAVFQSGPNGLAPSIKLAENLKSHGIEIWRFKTGTPARVNKRSLNYDKMEAQFGDSKPTTFSFMNDKAEYEELPCWLTYTNQTTHKVIQDNILRSAMYGGQIEGTGTRYCPSIEDKITRFADKERHQLFVEPEGYETSEMYVQGMSTSLPEDVQTAFMRTIPGLESVEVMRPAYAIEYDCVDPSQLKNSLEFKAVHNLFSAGQFNGSSGYEEAAAQGLIAGINAALKVRGQGPFTLDRSEAYIGVLIDDLVTKGTNEPYRMMTSRAEYRLLLRQDNADMRLTEKSFLIGLASQERYDKLKDKLVKIENEMARLQNTIAKPELINPILERGGSSPVKQSISYMELLRRPEIDYALLEEIDTLRPEMREDVYVQCEIQLKYQGYITKQLQQVERFKHLEVKRLPEGIDYHSIEGLRLEARQKLMRIQPDSIGQASRISGVSPADISVLMIYLEQRSRKRGDRNGN